MKDALLQGFNVFYGWYYCVALPIVYYIFNIDQKINVKKKSKKGRTETGVFILKKNSIT